MTTSVRPATQADIPAAVNVLAAAFRDYPWTRWVIPNDDYPHRLAELQEIYLQLALKHGVVLVDSQVRAVTALMPPTAPTPPATIQKRIADLHGARLHAVANLDLPTSPSDAWTLATLGVVPEGQGAGLGTLVATAALQHLDEAGAPRVFLETSDARNVRFYERLGFALTGTNQTGDGPDVHSMIRNSSPARS